MTRSGSWLKRAMWALTALALLALFLSPLTFGEFRLRVSVIIIYYLILAASWNILAGYVGLFSFAHAALAAVGAYVSAGLVLGWGVPIGLSVVGAALATATVGFLLGIISLRVRGIYLVLITWAFAIGVERFLTLQVELTGGANGLQVPLLFADSLSSRPHYLLGLLLLGIFIAAQALILRNPIRSYLIATRDDEDAAAALGVKVTRWKVIIFVYTSAWAGIAGWYFAHFAVFIGPRLSGFTEMAQILVATVLGGMGTLLGPFLGVIVVRVPGEYFRGALAEYSLLALALFVIILMRVAGGGIVHLGLRLADAVLRR